jgi:DegV family protein with EDD domain
MSERIALVTDSLCDLPQELVNDYKVTVVPITIYFGEESFKDGVDITDAEFYARMRTSDVMPRTSQPAPLDFEIVYKQLLKEYDSIISIHISIKLSGTLQSATLARQSLSEADQARVHIFDTLSGSMGEGLIVHAAGEAIKEGKSTKQVVAAVEYAIENSGIIWIPGSLKYLQKNGRIGGASALLGSILNIKPLIGCRASVYTVDKVRGLKNAVPKFIEHLKKKIDPASLIIANIINNNMDKEANELERAMNANFKVKKMLHSGMGPGIGCHIGPDTFGVSWYLAN